MSFFRHETLDVGAARRASGVLTRVRRREIDGVIVKGVYDAATCGAICAALEAGRHGLVRTDFPAKFAAYFLGVNLNLAHPDLTDYFAEAKRFHAGLKRLFPGGLDIEARVGGLLAAMDESVDYVAPPGARADDRYMFTTLRAHLRGGYIPAHFDDEQAARPSYRLLTPMIRGSLFSFVLAFSKPEEGGALEVFNLEPRESGRPIALGGRSAPLPDLDGVEKISFRLDPGDMIVFNSGRLLHRVSPVVGDARRWTACSFMAESHDGAHVYCWG